MTFHISFPTSKQHFEMADATGEGDLLVPPIEWKTLTQTEKPKTAYHIWPPHVPVLLISVAS